MGEYAEYALESFMNRGMRFPSHSYSSKKKKKEDHKKMADRVTVFVPGVVFWAKVIGEPRLNYEKDGREWTYDFVPDDTSFLKEHRLLDRLKEAREPIPGPYLRMRKSELTKDGEKNEPIRIYDADNNAWDNRLLGNGTRVVAKLAIVDYGKGKKKGIYTTALRVEDLVPFETNEFGGYDGGKAEPEAKAKPKGKPQTILEELDEGLDDDLPF